MFWRNPRIISELPQGSVSTGQLPSYFRVPTSRRVLSCRKKMSFSRRDPSWFLHQLPSNHDRFLALFSNIRFASLAHRTLAGSRKAHEWDGSFCSRDLSSHIFCGSASYFVTRRLSLPCHSTQICIAAAALSRAVGLSLILVDSFCCTAPADLQSSAKRLRPGLVNFVSAVAYHSCLSLPAAFTQPGRSFLADPCTFL